MDTWIWIVIALVLVVAAVVVVGLVRSKRSVISLREETPAVEEKPKPKPGSYKAGGSISFSSGGTPTLERTETDGQPGVGDDAAVPRDSVRPTITDIPLPVAEPVTPATKPAAPPHIPPSVTVPAPVAAPHPTPAPAPTAAPAASSAPEPVAAPEPVSAPEPVAAPEAAAAPEPSTVSGTSAPEAATQEATEPAAASTVIPSSTPAPEVIEPSPGAPRVSAPVVLPKSFLDDTDVLDVPVVTTPRTAAPTTTPPVTAPPVTAPRVTAPAPTEVELDDIDPTEGRLGRLRSRLSRSQGAFGRSMLGLLGAGTLDEDSWTDIEDTLLMADLGAAAAMEIGAQLRTEVARTGIASAADARALLRRVMIEALDPSMDRSIRALPHDGRPSVLLVVGVNGTGKTTTTGKLARVLVADGRTVVLGAADTFRAAAADQLQTWGERVGATIVRSGQGADPAAVAFDAVKKGIEMGADAVLIDTAGRLHTKTGLMDELGKVKRVIEKQAEVDEVLLVLDATTGQNGMVQAKVFADVVKITGIALTKLDGTAKGGIVVAVQRALGVPVKLVGLGEGPDDLAPFEPGAFVDALLGD